jgi:hypothetical protein
VINAESQYSAVAVFDVNHDGMLDIYCGGFWYEGPTWRSHFVRDVERIRGRFDGYSHLPYDVNGDGWTDIITVNYRSSSIRWVEHPGPALGPWPIHTVAEPGPMETGRLFDIDGNGQLDVLPNGQDFAAWWEVARGEWVRHELPAEVAGHGGGFGDIDGDGRGDVLAPTGWAQAPTDARRERWLFHREFDLGRASVPILVVDVDRDGDNDIVWSYAHGFGLYWLEQTPQPNGSRLWTRHTIDTSWSQCHAPLWADLDGDGVSELIAGKRYMAHDGRDPGAFEPLVAYRYQFAPDSRTWKRDVISYDEQVSFGLDPKVVDVDGDGDLDLVASGRSGLYFLENLGPTPPLVKDSAGNNATPSNPAQAAVTQPAGGAALLSYLSDAGEPQAVTTLPQWQLRRRGILRRIEAASGPLPGSIDRVPLEAQVVPVTDPSDDKRTDKSTGYEMQRVSWRVKGQQRVTAELISSRGGDAPRPAVVCLGTLGQTGSGSGIQSTARKLADQGIVCLVLDVAQLSSGAESASASAGATTGSPAAATDQVSIDQVSIDQVWGCVRALDYLESLPGLRAERLGCYADASACQLAVLFTALDQRLIATCGVGAPAWANAKADEPTPFGVSVAELVATIAPRSIALAGLHSLADGSAVSSIGTLAAQVTPVFDLARTAGTTGVSSEFVMFEDASYPIDGWLAKRLLGRR